jgi:hypothetical protein
MVHVHNRICNVAIVVAVAGSIAGCSIAEKIVARNDAKRSAENYQHCMEANATAPQQCEALRLAMEEDERKQNNISTDISLKPGTPPPTYGNHE